MAQFNRVGVCGVFDGTLHEGHHNFLRVSKSYGVHLVVYLAPDSNIRQYKNREPLLHADKRKAQLLATNYVDEVVIMGENEAENSQFIAHNSLNLYCFGGDQTSEWNANLMALLEKTGCIIKRIPRYKDDLYSTTKLYFSD